MSLLSLSSQQKAQVRNAFTLIDSNSKDGNITLSDIVSVHKSLGIEIPSQETLKAMMGGREQLSFAHFSQILAEELAKLDDKTIIANALRVFATEENKHNLLIDVEELKEACCSVRLGEQGTGDQRLSRAAFDNLTKDFVKEKMDGRRMFHALNWLDAYIE